MMSFRLRIVFFVLMIPFTLSAQTGWRYVPVDSLRDLTDVINHIFKKNALKDTFVRKQQHIEIGVFPAIGYTLQTGFAVVVSANAVIFKKHRTVRDSTSLPSTVAARHFLFTIQPGNLTGTGGIVFQQQQNHSGFRLAISEISFLYLWTWHEYQSRESGPAELPVSEIPPGCINAGAPSYVPGCGIRAGLFLGCERSESQTGNETDFEKYGSGSYSVASGISFNFYTTPATIPSMPTGALIRIFC